VLSNTTPAEREVLVSPQPDVMESANKVALPLVSNRATHRNNGIAKYVITPHTPHTTQEQDVGVTLATLKAVDTQTLKPVSPNGFSYKMTFPETVHKLVMETNKSDPDLIHWILNGEAFVIREKVRGGDPITPFTITFAYFLHPPSSRKKNFLRF
jgi:hypothetical protein